MSNGEVKRIPDPRKSYKYTMKEELFCIAFTGKNLGNATQAAISAGYSKKSSREIACENMTKPHIQNLIEYLSQNRRKALTSEDIYENWYNIVNDDNVHTSIKARVLSDNARANGMYIDRQEINVSFELTQAAETIKYLQESLSYALTFLSREKKEGVVAFMERRQKELESDGN